MHSLLSALVLTLLVVPARGTLTFIGDVTALERTPSGVIVTCGGPRLHVSFVDPGVVRVRLERPGDESPLEAALHGLGGAAPSVRFHDDSLSCVVSSEELGVVIRKKPCRLLVRHLLTDTVISEDDPGLGMGWDGQQVKAWRALAPGERFFGLGEKTGSLDLRGRELILWNTDNPHHDNTSDPLYQSVPFFIGLRGGVAYGLFFNNSYRTRFNFGAGNLRFSSFSAEGGLLDYFVIAGPSVARVVERYTSLTGRTPMPPLWALGYQQCRWSYYPEAEVLRIAQTFRGKRIPCDVIYLDIHHMDGYRVFTWHPEYFPNPRRLIETLGQMGFKTAVIVDPGVKVDEAYWVAREGLRGDHFLRYPDGALYVGEVWAGPSYFPDFSRPQTRTWWGTLFQGLVEVGVRGFWNDMNEPAVWGQAFPDEVVFDDEGRGADGRKMHNLFGLLMARSTYEGVTRLRPNERPLVITRAAFAGVQRFSAVWTGDNQATWEHLEMGVRMLQGMGVSGIPFVGTDVGGFGGTPTPELFARWIQFGAVSPFFRTHTHWGSPAQEPWSFGEDVEAVSREWIRWRYAMLPYLYSLFWEAHTTGAPPLRPLLWHFQEDAQVCEPEAQLQAMLGAHLMVAPVTRPGCAVRRVYFPQGRWLDLHTGEIAEGPAWRFVEAPLARMPLFLRHGGILASQEPMEWVGERESRRLFVDVWPATQTGSFTLYEDDGRTFEYAHGAYRTTELSCVWDQGAVRLVVRPLHEGYTPMPQALELRVHDCSSPSEVREGGRVLSYAGSPEGWRYDASRRTVTVVVKDHRLPRRIEIFL